jgi:hypothetical protein
MTLDPLHHQLADALRKWEQYGDANNLASPMSREALAAYDAAKAAPAEPSADDPYAPLTNEERLTRAFHSLEKKYAAAEAECAKLRDELKTLKCGGLSQKPFLYGMVYTDGKPVIDEMCVAEHPGSLTEEADALDANVLPLYTGPQVIHMAERATRADDAYNELFCSVMNLTHPNCKQLLDDKRKAEARLEAMTSYGAVDSAVRAAEAYGIPISHGLMQDAIAAARAEVCK